MFITTTAEDSFQASVSLSWCHCAHLGDRVVGGVGCLQALVARDSHPDMSSLDHSDIVSAIADSQRDDFHLFLHHLHHF